MLPITVAMRSKAWTVFIRSNTGILGSNPTWGMDVCMHLFCVCAVLYVQVAALRRADLPSEESYRLCKKIKKLKSGQGPTKGCRAIDKLCKWLIICLFTIYSIYNSSTTKQIFIILLSATLKEPMILNIYNVWNWNIFRLFIYVIVIVKKMRLLLQFIHS
jgi:hypothetical protein